MKSRVTFSLAFLLLFSLISISPVSAGDAFNLVCPDQIQIGDLLNCSIISEYPTGINYQLILSRSGLNPEEITRQTVINRENKAQVRSFSTKGLPSGKYIIDIQVFDAAQQNFYDPHPVLYSADEKQVLLFSESSRDQFSSIQLPASSDLFSQTPVITTQQTDIHETFYDWYWCRYEPVEGNLSENGLILRQNEKVCYQFFWDGSYARGTSSGQSVDRIPNDRWKKISEDQYTIRCQTFSFYGDHLETTLNPSFGLFNRSKTGVVDQRWGSQGTRAGQFSDPRGIAIDKRGDVYVADMINNGVQKFSAEGKYLSQLVGPDVAPFIYPEGIAINSDDYIYVIDSQFIKIFSPNGTFLDQWNPFSVDDMASENNYNRKALATDTRNNVYVTIHNHIEKFTSEGKFLTGWGSEGSGDGQFNMLWSVAVDNNNDIYVTDFGNNRVQKFTSDGKFLTSWGMKGSGDGKFDGPVGIAIDSDNTVYVTDAGNRRIQAFSPNGTYLKQWGWKPAWSGREESFTPESIAVDNNGFLYVTDGNSIRKIFPTVVKSPD